MRVLVLGAGAVGGYFGGRLFEAGRDVSFLVRPRRAVQLQTKGLEIRSPFGDAVLKAPSTITGPPRAHYDLVLLSCKAYDLHSALEAIAPAIGPSTAILPLLNGLHHLDVLTARFGTDRLLGGSCLISSTMDKNGAIHHLNKVHEIRFGEISGAMSPRVEAIAKLLEPATMTLQASGVILQLMWEKWVGLATLAGITCLMRGSVGDIVAAPGGRELVLQLLEECVAVAVAHGYSPRSAFLDTVRNTLTEPDSKFAASMLRDVERGGPTESAHVLGDLVARAGQKQISTPLLAVALCHLNAYDHRRAKEAPADAIPVLENR